ncbi:uncharacterized protein LOC124496022 [Dermatophagoides farinae]|uniref:uncharacterized protein LOC124496022 n=1 Tax=Dermatophagoides farinae TaxID=6954 RepID=UPI003F5FD16D
MEPFTVWILAITLLLTIMNNVPTNGDCPSPLKIDRECASQFLYFGKRDSILTFDDGLYIQNCEAFEDGMICLSDYIDECLHGTARMAADALYGTIIKQYNKRCMNETMGKKFIEHSQCLRDHSKMEKFHQCGDYYFHRIHQIQQIPDRDYHILAACCSMAYFHSCVDENNRKLCNDYDDNGQFWSKTFDEISGDVGLFCYGHETKDNCTKNFPQDIWQKYLQQPIVELDSQTLRRRWKYISIVMSNIDVAAKYEL